MGSAGTIETENSILACNNVSKIFTADNGRIAEALKNVSFISQQGEFICILGPTGCGKTTLLRLISGLEKLSSGSISVSGSDPVTSRNRMGMVFQQNALFPWLTVLQNVMFGLITRKWKHRDAVQRARECLELVHLTGVEKAHPYELSGGMQQRVAIARAIATSPSILLMDEPFASVDERTRKKLQLSLLELWQKNKPTIIFVTHNIEEAVFLAQRIIVLDTEPGRIFSEFNVPLAYPRNSVSPDFVDILLKVRETITQIVG